MSQRERYGTRDLTYSAWHRRDSTGRFVGVREATKLGMIDMDGVEYNCDTMQPVALVESARDIGQPNKSATVTVNLARMARITAYVLLYKTSDDKNPANPACFDIQQFRVKRLWPDPMRKWLTISPQQWAENLLAIRADGECHLDEIACGCAALSLN